MADTVTDQIYKWGSSEYTPLKMLEDGLLYPLIAKVKEGYFGNAWEELSSGEILLIHKCESQTRVVVRDQNSRHFSMSKSYQALFYPVNKSGKKMEKKPKPLSELLEKHTIPFEVEVDSDSCHLVSGDQGGALMKLDRLTVEETYEERFLKANLIRPEGLNKNVRKIATYVKARLVISGNQDILKRVTAAAAAISVDGTSRNADQRILMFTPRQIADKHAEEVEKENIYETLEPSRLYSTRKELMYDSLAKKTTEADLVRMNVFESFGVNLKPTGRRTSIDRPIVTVNPKRNTSISHQKTAAEPSQASLTWKDIPRDIKTLSCNQVINSLKLMNMGKYEPKFKENKVDGELLVELERPDLISDLGMSGLDAKKMMMFAKENWRPKEEAVPVGGIHRDDTVA